MVDRTGGRLQRSTLALANGRRPPGVRTTACLNDFASAKVPVVCALVGWQLAVVRWALLLDGRRLGDDVPLPGVLLGFALRQTKRRIGVNPGGENRRLYLPVTFDDALRGDTAPNLVDPHEFVWRPPKFSSTHQTWSGSVNPWLVIEGAAALGKVDFKAMFPWAHPICFKHHRDSLKLKGRPNPELIAGHVLIIPRATHANAIDVQPMKMARITWGRARGGTRQLPILCSAAP